jgi:hypothetical protein
MTDEENPEIVMEATGEIAVEKVRRTAAKVSL